jgi:hypothetical protein
MLWQPYHDEVLEVIQTVQSCFLYPLERDILLPLADGVRQFYNAFATFVNFLINFVRKFIFDLIIHLPRCRHLFDFFVVLTQSVAPLTRALQHLMKIFFLSMVGVRDASMPHFTKLVMDTAGELVAAASSIMDCYCAAIRFVTDAVALSLKNEHLQCAVANYLRLFQEGFVAFMKLVFYSIEWLYYFAMWLFTAGGSPFPVVDPTKLPSLDPFFDVFITMSCCLGDYIDDVIASILNVLWQILGAIVDDLPITEIDELPVNVKIGGLVRGTIPPFVEITRLVVYTVTGRFNLINETLLMDSLEYAVREYGDAGATLVGPFSHAVSNAVLAVVRLFRVVVQIAIHVRNYAAYRKIDYECAFKAWLDAGESAADGIDPLINLIPSSVRPNDTVFHGEAGKMVSSAINIPMELVRGAISLSQNAHTIEAYRENVTLDCFFNTMTNFTNFTAAFAVAALKEVPTDWMHPFRFPARGLPLTAETTANLFVDTLRVIWLNIQYGDFDDWQFNSTYTDQYLLTWMMWADAMGELVSGFGPENATVDPEIYEIMDEFAVLVRDTSITVGQVAGFAGRIIFQPNATSDVMLTDALCAANNAAMQLDEALDMLNRNISLGNWGTWDIAAGEAISDTAVTVVNMLKVLNQLSIEVIRTIKGDNFRPWTIRHASNNLFKSMEVTIRTWGRMSSVVDDVAPLAIQSGSRILTVGLRTAIALVLKSFEPDPNVQPLLAEFTCAIEAIGDTIGAIASLPPNIVGNIVRTATENTSADPTFDSIQNALLASGNLVGMYTAQIPYIFSQYVLLWTGEVTSVNFTGIICLIEETPFYIEQIINGLDFGVEGLFCEVGELFGDISRVLLYFIKIIVELLDTQTTDIFQMFGIIEEVFVSAGNMLAAAINWVCLLFSGGCTVLAEEIGNFATSALNFVFVTFVEFPFRVAFRILEDVFPFLEDYIGAPVPEDGTFYDDFINVLVALQHVLETSADLLDYIVTGLGSFLRLISDVIGAIFVDTDSILYELAQAWFTVMESFLELLFSFMTDTVAAAEQFAADVLAFLEAIWHVIKEILYGLFGLVLGLDTECLADGFWECLGNKLGEWGLSILGIQLRDTSDIEHWEMLVGISELFSEGSYCRGLFENEGQRLRNSTAELSRFTEYKMLTCVETLNPAARTVQPVEPYETAESLIYHMEQGLRVAMAEMAEAGKLAVTGQVPTQEAAKADLLAYGVEVDDAMLEKMAAQSVIMTGSMMDAFMAYTTDTRSGQVTAKAAELGKTSIQFGEAIYEQLSPSVRFLIESHKYGYPFGKPTPPPPPHYILPEISFNETLQMLLDMAYPDSPPAPLRNFMGARWEGNTSVGCGHTNPLCPEGSDYYCLLEGGECPPEWPDCWNPIYRVNIPAGCPRDPSCAGPPSKYCAALCDSAYKSEWFPPLCQYNFKHDNYSTRPLLELIEMGFYATDQCQHIYTYGKPSDGFCSQCMWTVPGWPDNTGYSNSTKIALRRICESMCKQFDPACRWVNEFLDCWRDKTSFVLCDRHCNYGHYDIPMPYRMQTPGFCQPQVKQCIVDLEANISKPWTQNDSCQCPVFCTGDNVSCSPFDNKYVCEWEMPTEVHDELNVLEFFCPKTAKQPVFTFFDKVNYTAISILIGDDWCDLLCSPADCSTLLPLNCTHWRQFPAGGTVGAKREFCNLFPANFSIIDSSTFPLISAGALSFVNEGHFGALLAPKGLNASMCPHPVSGIWGNGYDGETKYACIMLGPGETSYQSYSRTLSGEECNTVVQSFAWTTLLRTLVEPILAYLLTRNEPTVMPELDQFAHKYATRDFNPDPDPQICAPDACEPSDYEPEVCILPPLNVAPFLKGPCRGVECIDTTVPPCERVAAYKEMPADPYLDPPPIDEFNFTFPTVMRQRFADIRRSREVFKSTPAATKLFKALSILKRHTHDQLCVKYPNLAECRSLRTGRDDYIPILPSLNSTAWSCWIVCGKDYLDLADRACIWDLVDQNGSFADMVYFVTELPATLCDLILLGDGSEHLTNISLMDINFLHNKTFNFTADVPNNVTVPPSPPGFMDMFWHAVGRIVSCFTFGWVHTIDLEEAGERIHDRLLNITSDDQREDVWHFVLNPNMDRRGGRSVGLLYYALYYVVVDCFKLNCADRAFLFFPLYIKLDVNETLPWYYVPPVSPLWLSFPECYGDFVYGILDYFSFSDWILDDCLIEEKDPLLINATFSIPYTEPYCPGKIHKFHNCGPRLGFYTGTDVVAFVLTWLFPDIASSTAFSMIRPFLGISSTQMTKFVGFQDSVCVGAYYDCIEITWPYVVKPIVAFIGFGIILWFIWSIVSGLLATLGHILSSLFVWLHIRQATRRPTFKPAAPVDPELLEPSTPPQTTQSRLIPPGLRVTPAALQQTEVRKRDSLPPHYHQQ